MAIRDMVKTLSPSWLQDGAAERYVYGGGLAMDAVLEKAVQAIHARMPTKADPSALAYIGADRLIPRGLTESDSSYATRLQHAYEDWQIAGSPWATLREVLGFLLAVKPAARTVASQYTSTGTCTGSTWNSYASGDDTSSAPQWAAGIANFDLDSATPTNGSWGWWRGALILYADTTPVGGAVTAATNAAPIAITTTSAHGLATGDTVYVDGVAGNLAANGRWVVTVTGSTTFTLQGSSGSDPWTSGGLVYKAWGQNWVGPAPFVVGSPGVKVGQRPDASVGLSVPSDRIAAIRQIAALWKAGHFWVRTIIVSLDSSLFDPAQASGGGVNPDGKFGRRSKIVNRQYVRARYSNARYATGVV
jgi:hypothetical protein